MAAYIHLDGAIIAQVEQDISPHGGGHYVRLQQFDSIYVYLPARDEGHARRIAAAINDTEPEPRQQALTS